MILRPKACPAHTAACQKKSYLVAGDLVLLGKTQGDFTCVDYQSPLATKQVWTVGWLPSAALTPVAPMLAPKTSDWVGTWYHPGGSIEIKNGKRDILDVEGGMTVPTANDFHNGGFKAQVTPKNDTVAFADDAKDAACDYNASAHGCWPWTIADVAAPA